MLDVGIAMDIEMTNLTPIALPLVGKKRGRRPGSGNKKDEVIERLVTVRKSKTPSAWAANQLGKAGSTRASINGTLNVKSME